MNKPLILAGILALSTSACAYDNNYHHDKDGMTNSKADYYFDTIDTNNDEFVNRAEYKTFGTQMFNEADTNEDNVVSRDEFRAEKQREMNNYRASRNANDYDRNDNRYEHNGNYYNRNGNYIRSNR